MWWWMGLAGGTILFSLMMDVGDIIMMRKSILGIKRRAEAMAKNAARARQTRRDGMLRHDGFVAP